MDAFKYIPAVLKIMQPYPYESEGALVCDVKKEEDNRPMPPLMVIKKDGASIYGTRDLGTIYSRMERFNPDEIWYFTDERQSLYFEQVFRACYKTGLVKESTKLKHFGFGTINGKDGKPYKTRDGGVMELDSLINMIRLEVEKNIKEEITGLDRDIIADKLSIATLKYADLLPFRKTDYIFDPEKFASLDGKTGPYVLYTLVRIKSLLKKSDIDEYKLFGVEYEEKFKCLEDFDGCVFFDFFDYNDWESMDSLLEIVQDCVNRKLFNEQRPKILQKYRWLQNYIKRATEIYGETKRLYREKKHRY